MDPELCNGRNHLLFNLKTKKMRNLFSSALRCHAKYFAGYRSVAIFSSSIILIGFLYSGCKKEATNTPADEIQSINSFTENSEARVINNYTGLSSQTTWELQQARAATARYRDLKNAIKDGYSNINVDVPNMGHHFMKTSLVDATFDI